MQTLGRLRCSLGVLRDVRTKRVWMHGWNLSCQGLFGLIESLVLKGSERGFGILERFDGLCAVTNLCTMLQPLQVPLIGFVQLGLPCRCERQECHGPIRCRRPVRLRPNKDGAERTNEQSHSVQCPWPRQVCSQTTLGSCNCCSLVRYCKVGCHKPRRTTRRVALRCV